MNKYLKLILAMLLITPLFSAEPVAAQSGHQHDHGMPLANFIPEQILNPDDSVYVAPEAAAELVGLYTTEIAIEELEANLKSVLNIQADGLFNLAYYFENTPEATGLRFYVNQAGEVESLPAVYQDLTIMTGALTQLEDGLGSGLISETLSPIVLLDEKGQASELYAYQEMAYGLRENKQNARVYQSVGLYVKDQQVLIDAAHLIGLATEQELLAQFVKVDDSDEQFLVEAATFELLQANFDTYLEEHNDFILHYTSANDFLQKVLSMHLETNASFPQDTQVTLVEVELSEGEAEYGLLINEMLLYAYDNTETLYMANEFSQTEDGAYRSEAWQTQHQEHEHEQD